MDYHDRCDRWFDDRDENNDYPASHRRRRQQTSPQDDDRKPMGYFNDLSNAQIASGAFQLLAPGVTRIQLPDDESTVTLRHIIGLFPLTNRGALYARPGVDKLVATIMALHHFNNRVSSIVPQIAELDDCDIRFTLEVVDTERSSIASARYLLENVFPRREEGVDNSINAHQYPTAMLGAYRSAVSAQVAVISALYNLTQVSYGSASERLSDKGRYPFFGRTIVGVGGIAIASTDFLKDALGATHVFCIYVRDAFGIDFQNAFQARATQLGITTISASLNPECIECMDEDIDKALDALAESGFKYVYAILSQPQYRAMMPKAYQRGLAGPDSGFWLFDDTFVPQPNSPNSTLLAASHGSAVLKFAEDALLANTPAFQEEWDKYMFSDGARSLLEGLFPANVRPLLEAENYEVPLSPSTTLFAYDAFMAVALAACDAQSKHGTLFTPHQYHESFLASEFDGATNRVRFNPKTGTRTEETMTFHMANYRADGPPDEDGKITLRSHSTHVYVDGSDRSRATWQPLPGEAFIFADNTTATPPGLPPLNGNLEEIDIWATVVGFVVLAIIACVSLGFCLWMQLKKDAQPVAATQPVFVWMLGIGTILMGASLVPQAVLPYSSIPDTGCMLSPWLMSTGFCVALAALFSKLMRVAGIHKHSKRMLRVIIKPRHVLKPFLILLSLNFAILIAWTVFSPLEYEEEVASSDYDRYGRLVSRYATCNSNNAAYFRVSLGVLDIVALATTAVFSYRTRNVDTRFNESARIFLALIISSQSFLIGIPGVLAAGDNPSVEFFCRSFAILWGCLGLLLPICLPILDQYREWELELIQKERRKSERIRSQHEFFSRISRLQQEGTSAEPPGKSTSGRRVELADHN